MTNSDTTDALAAECALRAKRAAAVAAVAARLQASRTEAEGKSAAAATVVAVLRSRVEQLRAQRGRLEAEHAEALTPTPEVAAAEAALASAVERSRAVPIGDDGAATAAAHAQAEAEDALVTARQEAAARNVRPIALRLQITSDQADAAARELQAAQSAADAAAEAVRRALQDILRLRRDAAALAFDEASTDLVLAGGAKHADQTQVVLGESADLLSELNLPVDFYFGSSPRWRLRSIGRVDPAALVDPAAAEPTQPPTRKSGKLLAA